MALLLVHQTQQQFVQRFFSEFRVSAGERTIQLARFVLNKIANGDLTDSQCRNAANKTVLEWTNLKTKMQNWVDNYDSSQAAVGE